MLKLDGHGMVQFGLDHCKAISRELLRVLAASSKSEIAQGRMIVGTATKRPVIPAFTLLDRKIVAVVDIDLLGVHTR